MKIVYLPKFDKNFRLLATPDKDSVVQAIDLFKNNPHDPSLRNHALEKPMTGKRSISAGEDLRVIFRERGGYIEVLMLDVGSHEDIYLR